MFVYYFITPTSNSPGHNPGCSFITHGIKFLVRHVDPEGCFLDVSIADHNKQAWDLLLDNADALIFCGNPRYNPSDVRFYWDWDIWDHIKAARDRGILVADLFCGSAWPVPMLSIDVMSKDLLGYQRNKRTLYHQLKVDMVCTRDALAQAVLGSVRTDSALLLCSSYWAASWFKVPVSTKRYNCVVLSYVKDDPWVVSALADVGKELALDKETFFLCHAGFEYWWARQLVPDIKNLVCIYDPLSLLQFYAQCDKVVSMRLHGSIPALSLGCQVVNVAIDSRCLSFDNFGFSSVPYTDLKQLPGSLHFYSGPVDVAGSFKTFLSLFDERILRRLISA